MDLSGIVDQLSGNSQTRDKRCETSTNRQRGRNQKTKRNQTVNPTEEAFLFPYIYPFLFHVFMLHDYAKFIIVFIEQNESWEFLFTTTFHAVSD